MLGIGWIVGPKPLHPDVFTTLQVDELFQGLKLLI